jgi:hypothetical protein
MGTLADHFDLQDGYDVRDAPRAITVASTKADANGAVVLDPANCLFARACSREQHKAAVIFKTVAYVRQSSKLIYKYSVPPTAQAIITAFDVTGIASYGTPIALMVPRPQERVGARTGQKANGPGQKRTEAERAKIREGQGRANKYRRKLDT